MDEVEINTPALEPVQLSMAHQFMAKHIPGVGTNKTMLPGQEMNPFSDIGFFENRWYDNNGDDISLAVDNTLHENECQTERTLLQQLRIHDGHLEPMLEDDILEDATIPTFPIVDDEECDDVDVGDMIEDGPEWFPHGCKTVSDQASTLTVDG